MLANVSMLGVKFYMILVACTTFYYTKKETKNI